jgi:hypothetical protein
LVCQRLTFPPEEAKVNRSKKGKGEKLPKELGRQLAALKAQAGNAAKSGAVYCPECGRSYLPSELVRRSWSSPGMKRSCGGPNGAWRAVWRCCPEGHKLIQVSFRIS